MKRSRRMIAKLNRLRAEGLTPPQIAKELGVSAPTVRTWIAEQDAKNGPLPSRQVAPPASSPPVDDPTEPDEHEADPDDGPTDAESELGVLDWIEARLKPLAEKALASGDIAQAASLARIISPSAIANARLKAKQSEDGDVVKVRAADMKEHAAKARGKLLDLVQRLREDRTKAGTP